jgi:hypothetical protein
VYVTLPLGKNTTSLGSKWKLPTANVKNLTVSPAWANQFYEFPYGETKITWTATNGDGKTDSCRLSVYVQGQSFESLRKIHANTTSFRFVARYNYSL